VKPVLLDTGPIVAMLDRSERNHKRCAEVVASIEAPLITCEAAITEACYLLRNIPKASSAVLENVARGMFLIPFRLQGRADRLVKLMKKYADVPMDFADACLVDLAGELKTGRILTLDADFQIYRWSRNRPFEMLLEA